MLAPGVALQFLTVVPVRLPRSIAPAAFPNAVALFPVVGLVLGGVAAIVDRLLSGMLPSAVVAPLDLMVLAVLSGGLHLDGLADATDGLLGAVEGTRRLEIMREPGVGAFGVIAVALVLVTEVTALSALTPLRRELALVAAATLARWTMSVMLCGFPYARAQGSATALRRGLRGVHGVIAALIAALVVLGVLGPAGLVSLTLAAALALAVGMLAVRRLGGCTGDVYGAGGELTFAAVLVIASAVS